MLRTHVDRSLTCCSAENSKVLGYQNVVDGVRQHPQLERAICRGTSVLSRADFIRSHAQFEDDTLGNIQPVKVMVKDVTKTAVEFPCTSDDAAAAFKTRCSFSVQIFGALAGSALP